MTLPALPPKLDPAKLLSRDPDRDKAIVTWLDKLYDSVAASLADLSTRVAALETPAPAPAPAPAPDPTPAPAPTPTGTVPTPAPIPSDPVAAVLALLGPTRSIADAGASIPGASAYDATFAAKIGTRLTADAAPSWSAGNYYDRAAILYAMWARGGPASWRTMADAYAVNYRDGYLVANAYNASAYWAMLNGVAVHAALTRDPASLTALAETAWRMAWGYVYGEYGHLDTRQDTRTKARVLEAYYLAWRIGAPRPSGAPDGAPTDPTAFWAAQLDTALAQVLASQRADGYWSNETQCTDAAALAEGTTQRWYAFNAYMHGMLHDLLGRLLDGYPLDATRRAAVVSAIVRGNAVVWTQWRSADAVPSFNYESAQCSGSDGGSPTPTPDLTLMLASSYALEARLTAGTAGSATALQRADAVFAAGLQGMQPDYAKQFNQAYTTSYRYLGWRP